MAQARQAAGLTQVQLAEKTGQAPRTIQAWERGERHPRIDGLTRVALVVDRPIAWFYENGSEAA